VRRFSKLLLAILPIAIATAGCAPNAAPAIALADTTVLPDRPALVIWIDGLGWEAYEALLKAGRLPNAKRYFVDRGVSMRAVASYPTITYANNVSFSTGLFPGHHGVHGNKWFDRDKLIYQDYTSIGTYRQVDGDFEARTIYELLGEAPTATILTPVRRGATQNIDNWATAGISWFFRMHTNVNRLTTARFEMIAETARTTGKWPVFILAYYVTPDTLAHAKGPSHPDYTKMILDVDLQVGRVCQAYENAGLLDKTTIAFISDHGFLDTPKLFDVGEFFRKGMHLETRDRLYGRDVSMDRRRDHFGDARAVVVAGGNRRCSIHLRVGDEWSARPTEKQIERCEHGFYPGPHTGGEWTRDDTSTVLVSQESVDLLMVRLGPNSVRVRTKAGDGVIDRVVREGRKLYRYRVTKGTDPLGHASDLKTKALMDGGYHDGDAWLAASMDTPRPDAVVQLIEMNDSPRSGDIVLFAARGWDFFGGDAGGHGGLTREEILVPWLIAGPDLPARATLDAARTVDLMPTMLHLIGKRDAIPTGLDGRDLVGRLRAAAGDRVTPAGEPATGNP